MATPDAEFRATLTSTPTSTPSRPSLSEHKESFLQKLNKKHGKLISHMRSKRNEKGGDQPNDQQRPPSSQKDYSIASSKSSISKSDRDEDEAGAGFYDMVAASPTQQREPFSYTFTRRDSHRSEAMRERSASFISRMSPMRSRKNSRATVMQAEMNERLMGGDFLELPQDPTGQLERKPSAGSARARVELKVANEEAVRPDIVERQSGGQKELEYAGATRRSLDASDGFFASARTEPTLEPFPEWDIEDDDMETDEKTEIETKVEVVIVPPEMVQLQKDVAIAQLQKDVEIIQLQKDAEIVQLQKDAEIVQLQKDAEIVQLQKDAEIVQPQKDAEIIQPQKDAEIVQPQKDAEIVQPQKDQVRNDTETDEKRESETKTEVVTVSPKTVSPKIVQLQKAEVRNDIPKRLLSLPNEILEEMALLLDTNSTWFLRLSCKKLYDLIPTPSPPTGSNNELHTFFKQIRPLFPPSLSYCLQCKKYHPWTPSDYYTDISKAHRCRRYLCSNYQPMADMLRAGNYLCANCNTVRPNNKCITCLKCEGCAQLRRNWMVISWLEDECDECVASQPPKWVLWRDEFEGRMSPGAQREWIGV